MKKLILPAILIGIAYYAFGKGSNTTVVIDEPAVNPDTNEVTKYPGGKDLKNLKPVSLRPAAQSPARISPTGNELLLHNNQTRVIP